MALLIFLGHAVFAQSDTYQNRKKKTNLCFLNLANRANDHFMIEFSYDNWIGKADTMNTSGFSTWLCILFHVRFPF